MVSYRITNDRQDNMILVRFDCSQGLVLTFLVLTETSFAREFSAETPGLTDSPSNDSGQNIFIFLIIGTVVFIVILVILVILIYTVISKSSCSHSQSSTTVESSSTFAASVRQSLARLSRIDAHMNGNDAGLSGSLYATPTLRETSFVVTDVSSHKRRENVEPLPPRTGETLKESQGGPKDVSAHRFTDTCDPSSPKHSNKHSYINVSDSKKDHFARYYAQCSVNYVDEDDDDDDDSSGYSLVSQRLMMHTTSGYNKFSSKISNKPVYASVQK